MNTRTLRRRMGLTVVSLSLLAQLPALAANMHETGGQVLAEYTRMAGSGANPTRGQRLLETISSGALPTRLALDEPVNHRELEAWFEARCQAAMSRPCAAGEKADMSAHALRAGMPQQR